MTFVLWTVLSVGGLSVLVLLTLLLWTQLKGLLATVRNSMETAGDRLAHVPDEAELVAQGMLHTVRTVDAFEGQERAVDLRSDRAERKSGRRQRRTDQRNQAYRRWMLFNK